MSAICPQEPVSSASRRFVRSACVVALGSWCAVFGHTTQADAERPKIAGLPLSEAISALENAGLRVFYSSAVVKPSMRVRAEPPDGPPREQLDAILEPLGLRARDGPRGSLVIERAPSPPPTTPASAESARPASGPARANAVPAIDEIVVAASVYQLGSAVEPSRDTIAATQLERLPDVGEDALRAVQRLPGQASNGLSARTNIRGGETSETLFRFDGLRLYDPYHFRDFQGIFGTIDPQIVQAMDVYTGGFPATFGDRLSGVVDVKSISPTDVRTTTVGVSLFDDSIMSTGLFRRGGEWVVSARRSNLDLLYDSFATQHERVGYVDAYAKVSYPIGDHLRVTASALYFRDDLNLTDSDDAADAASLDSADSYHWVRFDHSIGSALTGSTLVARTRLDSERTGVVALDGISSGALADSRGFEIDSLQTDWSWQAGDGVALSFGALSSRSRGSYDYHDKVSFALLFDVPGAPVAPERERALAVDPRGRQQDVYANVRVNPLPRLVADIGARWDEQMLDAARTSTIDPRIGLRYRVGEDTSLRMSWGRFHQTQAINELPVSDGISEFSAPQRSDEWVLGIERPIGTHARFRAEAYQKTLHDLRPHFENLLDGLALLPELEPDRIRVAPDSAETHGVELTITGNPGSVMTWWATYTWSKAMDWFGADEIPRSWDQRNALSGGASTDWRQWSFSIAVLDRTGWPTTPVSLDSSGDLPIVVAGERNSLRVEEYRSFDLRIVRKFATGRGSFSTFVEINNAFDRANPCCTEYELEHTEQGRAILSRSVAHYPGVIPSVGFVWSF